MDNENHIRLLSCENEILKERLQECRDELCLRCGKYKTAHLGNCDGCKYKEMKL